MCFNSEIKSILKVTDNVNEVLPGHYLDATGLTSFFKIETGKYLEKNPEQTAKELQEYLRTVIVKCIG